MKTATAEKVAAQFDSFLEASQDQPVLVTRRGKPVAVLVAVQNRSEAVNVASRKTQTLQSVLDRSHEQIKQGLGIPHEQFWREVEDRTKARQRSTTARRKRA